MLESLIFFRKLELAMLLMILHLVGVELGVVVLLVGLAKYFLRIAVGVVRFTAYDPP